MSLGKTQDKAQDNGNEIDYRSELDSLKKQFTELLSAFSDPDSLKSKYIMHKANRKLDHLKEDLTDKAEHVYRKGKAEADLLQLGWEIRKKPLTSMAIAFGAGFILSKLLSK